MSTTPANSHPHGARRRHPDTLSSRRWISINEASDYLGVTERTIRQMIADGRLVGYRNKTFIRLDLNEIDAAMQPYGGGVHA